MSNPADTDPADASAPALEWLGVLCRPDRAGRLDVDWLDSLRVALPGARLSARADLAATAGLMAWHGVEPQFDDPASLRSGIAEEEALLVLRSGVAPGPDLAARLQALRDAPECSDITVLPGNYHDQLNPLAGLTLAESGVDPHSLLAAAGTGLATPVRVPDEALVFLRPGFGSGTLQAGLIDDLFLIDPERPLDAGRFDLPWAQAAFGTLRARLARLLEARVHAVPEMVDTERPLTLHITHAWGGGIARWIADQCRGDRHGRHLILSAAGRQDGKEHGQVLRLLSGSADAAPLAEWPLMPAIADSVVEHPGYADLLDQIIQRFGVGRIAVSSLIGHSLDALRTGLPTLVMLHDFYPATPLLHEDPLASLGADGRLDLETALARQKQPLLFESEDPAHWKSLHQAWIEAVQVEALRLVAPTRHVAERWQRISDRRLPEIEIVPHGFAAPEGWPEALDFQSSSSSRLRMVVVGRISEGKGLRLLERALDALSPLARVTLLGAGRDSYALFGRAGVDIVLNYRACELPSLLDTIRPDAVLFLSTVPETWNYVLSEIRALGLTPIATRLGSFEERIEEGVDGLLFDPDPEDLVDTIRAWCTRPEDLRRLGRRAGREPSLAQAAAAYRARVPERASRPGWSPIIDQAAPRAGLLSESLRATERKARILAEQVDAQQRDLGKRADWARRSERLARERTDWARSMEIELERERAAAAQERVCNIETIDRLNLALRASQSQVVERDEQLQASRAELDEARAIIQARDAHLQLISDSLSWRMTRPLRFASRLAGKSLDVHLWNPLRWPSLAASGLRVLRQQGLSGLVGTLYAPSEQEAETAKDEVRESATPAVLDPVHLPSPDQPRVSIVIPVFNKVELTAACLSSLAEASVELDFEVLVVDDCSSDETADYLERCSGLRVLRNERNSGFIDSCNRGAAAARGEFLVFLNNDTTVDDDWLDALIAPFDQDSEVGIVGARLIYPDGRLQEAGGIVFSDASGWNYGKGDSADAPQYGFLSEADYVSGACLAIRRSDFEALEGFDTRFRPAYYEDTDLCFQVRAQGKKVLVQPACTIVHHEGATSGTDEQSGTKRYQAVNRERFREKWASVLADHPPPAPDPSRADPVRQLRYRRFRKRALVLDATTPQPDHDSGSVRIRAVLDLLLARGYQVSFMAQNRKYVPGYTDQLTQAGIEVLHAPAVTELEPWLAEHGADLDLVFASRHYVLAPWLPRLRQDAAQALLVFDTVDLHYLREQREAELLGQAHLAEQAAATRAQELSLIAQADVSLVVSPVEQALLAEEVPGADVRVLSNIHRVHGTGSAWPERSGLLFVGGFQHMPNVDAVQWFVSEVFPLVRAARPDMQLHLIGSRMPDSILALNDTPGIVVHGFVGDLEPHLDSARISVAPLRYGAGVKGKVNQAMSHGLPVVATPCAAEGMFLEHERDVLIAEDPAQFAVEVLRLDQDEALWNRLSQGGLANVETHFSRRAADGVLAGLEAAERRDVSRAGSVREVDGSENRREDPPASGPDGPVAVESD